LKETDAIWRKGDFTALVGGGQFWPLDPRAEEIHLDDIAHALSMQCRWGGHVRTFFSVAQHCVLVSLHCKRWPLKGLLHDAAEAYLVDVPTPIKKHLFGYSDIERGILGTIGERFDLGAALQDLPIEVHLQDGKALATEQRDLRPKYEFWAPPGRPWRERIVPMSQPAAKRAFLRRAHDLGLR
jgi:hypothetical protein